MYLVYVKDHILPIGAKSQKTVDEIKKAYGEENIVDVKTNITNEHSE